MTPLTSPSEIRAMRAPGVAHLGDQFGMARAVEDADDEIGDLGLFRAGEISQIDRRLLIEIDEVVGQSAADRNFVHVDVGSIEKMPPASAIAMTASALAPPLAVIVVPSSGSSAMSSRRAVSGSDLFADIEHWRLVALALADHHGAG